MAPAEQGVAMRSSVLNSERAIQVNSLSLAMIDGPMLYRMIASVSRSGTIFRRFFEIRNRSDNYKI